MASTQVIKASFADIVKGKQSKAAPISEGFNLNPTASEFVPPANASLNAFAKAFDPSEAQLLQKATEMQKVLLDYYSSDDESSEDESTRIPPRKAVPMAKRTPAKKATQQKHGAIRSPPGLCVASVKCAKPAELNPSAKEFDPACIKCPDSEAASNAAVKAALNPFAKEFQYQPPVPLMNHAMAINLDGYSSDDESPCSTPRATNGTSFSSKCLPLASKVGLVEDSGSTSAGSETASLSGEDSPKAAQDANEVSDMLKVMRGMLKVIGRERSLGMEC